MCRGIQKWHMRTANLTKLERGRTLEMALGQLKWASPDRKPCTVNFPSLLIDCQTLT
jgi:hypothetical protein